MKGLINIYINCDPEHQDFQARIDLFMSCNKDVLDAIRSENDYRVVVIPCVKESCRVEKVDMDRPWPRFVSKMHIDLDQLEKRREERRLEQERTKREGDQNV